MTRLRRTLRTWRRALGLWIAGERERPVGITDSAHHYFCDAARTVRPVRVTARFEAFDPTTAAAMLDSHRDEIAGIIARTYRREDGPRSRPHLPAAMAAHLDRESYRAALIKLGVDPDHYLPEPAR